MWLEAIFEFGQNIVSLFMIGYIVYLLVYEITNGKRHDKLIYGFKVLFSLMLVFFTVVTIMIITLINIYQVSVIFEDAEIPQYVLEFIFLAVFFVWQMIGILIIGKFWKLPEHEIIPRKIKDRWRNFRND